MESESPSIDPRYRPEFQRGYRGVAGPMPMPLPPTNHAGAPIRVGLPPADVPPADVPVADVPVADVPVADVPVADVLIADVPVRRRRNPYIVLIVLTSVFFIGFGTWLTARQSLIGMSSGGLMPDSVSFRFAQALTFTFAGPLVTIGFLALVGVGFFLAARRR